MKLFLLFVEDDADQALLLRLICKRVGLDATGFAIFHNGLEATAFLEGQPADFWPTRIISDIRMPKMGGLGLLAWIRTDHRYRDVPMTLLSSNPTETVAAQARAEGADVRTKSGDSAEFVVWIRAWAEEGTAGRPQAAAGG